MGTELKKEVGSLFVDVLELSQDSMPCICGRNIREVLLASSRKDIDLKRDSILYWCECGEHGLTNSEEDKLVSSRPVGNRGGLGLSIPPPSFIDITTRLDTE